MHIEESLLASQVKAFKFANFVRVIPTKHVATPLGCVPGHSRFGGSEKNFAVLYAARDLATSLAETIIRDRFEGKDDRRLFVSELAGRAAVELKSTKTLRLVDLRQGGCLKLGISTNVMGAKAFQEAQEFSDGIYKVPTIDGILYSSRLTGKNCVAVFDRVINSHLSVGLCAPLVQLDGIGVALDTLNIQLIG